jgi:type I restriction enzyme, S subunit
VVADSHVTIVRANKACNTSFLHYFIRSSLVQSKIEDMQSGSTNQVELSRGQVLNTVIPLAPLNEQKRIADKLDRILEKVDACRKRCDRIPLILKRFRQSVLAAATSGELTKDWREEDRIIDSAHIFLRSIDPKVKFLPPDVLGNIEIPKSWAITNFGNVVSNIRGGSTAVPQDEPTKFPILRSSSVRPCSVDLDDFRYVSEKNSQNNLNYLSEGDLLFTRLSGSLDYVANCAMVRNLEKQKIQYPDRLFCAKLIPQMNAFYCELVFAAPYVRKQITEHAKSSAGHQRVAIGDITNQPIAIAPLEEQQEIVRRVEILFAFADHLESRYQTARAKCDQLTPALLEKAFQGELVPQDPNDEPASVLLERIKSLRSSPETNQEKAQRRARRAG